MKLAMIVAALAIAAAPSAWAQTAGNADAGKKSFAKCLTCHTNEAGKSKPTGPNLLGVYGRKAGSTDFKYSQALTEAAAKGLVWDEKTLDGYLTDPKQFLLSVNGDPKAQNKMIFNIRDPAERQNLIAYLKTLK